MSISPMPTRKRYGVLMLLGMLAMITYLDRAVASRAKDDIMTSVGRDVGEFYILLVAFQLAYALFEVPSGWMGDTFGPRRTLLRIVLLWSGFIGLTALAGLPWPGTEIVLIGFVPLVVLQFLFGAGEAGAFPNITRAIYNWFPFTERGFAQGTVWMSARFMGGMTPLVWLCLNGFLGLSWREVLGVFALIAIGWCLLFAWFFRDRPGHHAGANQAERDLIEAGRVESAGHSGVPWGKLFHNPRLWLLCGMYTVTNYNWYFLMYYLPDFFKKTFPELQADRSGQIQVALMGGSPLLIGMLGCFLGGWLSDRTIARTGNRRWGRSIYGMVGYGMAGLCYLAAALMGGPGVSPWLFAGLLIAVGFFNDLIMGPAWATCQDVGGRYSAIVAGCMNMIGNIGAALGNLVTGLILSSFTENKEVNPTGYSLCFAMYALVYGLGALAWVVIDARRPLIPISDEVSTGESR